MSKKKHKIISIFLSIFKISSLSVVGFFLVLFIAKNIKVESDRLLEQGIAQLQSRQFDQATQSWNKSLKLYRLIGHRQGIAYSLGNLGNIYFSLDDYSQAIKYYQQSLEIKREIGDRQGIANSLGNLGRTYSLLGDDTQAIDYYQQSLKIEREIGDYEGIAISLRKLGSIYRSSGDYDRAIDYYQQSLKIYRDIGNFRKGIARSLHSLGAT